MKKAKKSGWYKALIGITAVLTFFAVCIIIAWLYLWLTDRFPETTGTNYVTSITDANGEEHRFLELNYYANTNGTGKEVAELTFNFYSDENMTNVMAYTIQRVTNVDEEGNKTYKWSYYQIAPEVNVSWSAVERLKAGDEASPMYIDINGEPYCVKLNGTYNYYQVDVLKSIPSLIVRQELTYNVKTYSYSVEQFFDACINHLSKSSEGYGSFNLPFVDLSGYFSIYKFDTTSKQWVEHTNVSEARNFFSFDVSTYRYGLVYASQSKVNMVNGDAEFNISGFQSEGEDYWKHFIVKNLTSIDFDLGYSAADNGYYLSIKDEVIDELMSFNDLKINVTIDLDYFTDKRVIGLDYYALFGLNISEFTVKSSKAVDFNLKDYSLWDTNLTTIKHSSSVNLIVSDYTSNKNLTMEVFT